MKLTIPASCYRKKHAICKYFIHNFHAIHTSFSSVRLSSNFVHCKSQSSVCLQRNASKTHGTWNKDYSIYTGISVLTKLTINDTSHNMCGQQTITVIISGSWIQEIIILHGLYHVRFSTRGLLCLSSASCLACLTFLYDLEDEGDIFLWQVGGLLMNYTVLQQRSYL